MLLVGVSDSDKVPTKNKNVVGSSRGRQGRLDMGQPRWAVRSICR